MGKLTQASPSASVKMAKVKERAIVIEDGMAQMSAKFKKMGGQVYVEADATKNSN